MTALSYRGLALEMLHCGHPTQYFQTAWVETSAVKASGRKGASDLHVYNVIEETIAIYSTWENVTTRAVCQAAVAWLKNCSLQAVPPPQRRKEAIVAAQRIVAWFFKSHWACHQLTYLASASLVLYISLRMRAQFF
ncbi:uncharacterized protein [Dermacentor albipictus]|uniref:uncharacterized protein n=1 Tax=Dermacentor albipictus TaxID=60249 RepID=UPI0038FBF83E